MDEVMPSPLQSRNAKTPQIPQRYSMEKMFRSTAAINQFRRHQQQAQEHPSLSKSQSSYPSIMVKMDQKRSQLEDYFRQSHTKLNQSFSHYYMKEAGVHQEELRRKKVTKKKKVEDKGEKLIEIPKANREERGFQESNIKLMALPNKCYDSLFPNMRYSPSLVAAGGQVYLLGGYHEQSNEGLSLFHRYDNENQRWVQVKSQKEKPPLGSSFHTIEVYKNNLIIVGGISLEGEKGGRYNTELLMFNF